jgi:hypothetical protein
VAAVTGAAEGDGLIELLGLKKSARVFFAGDGDGVTVGETAAVLFPLRACFSAGEGDASVVAAGETVASAFLCVRCFVGDGDAAGDSAGLGDWACRTEMLAMAITEMSARNLVVITPSVEKRSDCSQWICDEAGNVIETHEHTGDFREWWRADGWTRMADLRNLIVIVQLNFQAQLS